MPGRGMGQERQSGEVLEYGGSTPFWDGWCQMWAKDDKGGLLRAPGVAIAHRKTHSKHPKTASSRRTLTPTPPHALSPPLRCGEGLGVGSETASLRRNTPRRRTMASELPRLFLTRHGDTAWTES